jgi:hypothetical protein
MRKTLGTLLLALGVSAACAADAEVKPVMTQRGKAVLTDDLRQPLSEKWKAPKGDWKITDGVLRGVEKKEDMHAAAARIPAAFENGIIQVSFRLDGAKSIALSINDAGGHVGRVSIDEQGFALRKDKANKNATDPAKLIERRDTKLEPGKWYTLVLEMQGDEWLARIGDEAALGSHPGFKGRKTNLGLIVSGPGASFKDLRVWEATPAMDWDRTKQDLLGRRKK